MRAAAYFLTASIALNMAGLLLVDHSFKYEALKLELLKSEQAAKAAKDKIFLDFIESPAALRPQKPASARKISNQDSVSRDYTKNKTGKAAPPRTDKTGPADQLAQLPPNPKRNPRPQQASKAKEEMQKAKAASETKETLKPEKTKPEKETAPADSEGLAVHEARPEAAKAKPSAPESAVTQKKQPEREARSGKEELSGLDKIKTQEMTRGKSKGASLYGMTSFDAMGSDMGIYMKKLKEKIWLNWFPYLAFQYPADFKAADAYVSFTLDAKGDIKEVKLLDNYGSVQFATFCMEAIQRASGFGAVPKEILALLGKDQLEIKFAFHYR